MKKPLFNPAACLTNIIVDVSVRDFSRPDGEMLSVDAAKTSLIDIISKSAGYKGGADFYEYLKFTQQKDLSHLPAQLISLAKQIEDEVVQRYGHRHALAFRPLTSEEVILKVAHHPSGNLTLMYKTPEMRLYDDARGNHLFTNNDPRSFYKSAIRLFEFLFAAGRKVTFENLLGLHRLEGVLIPISDEVRMKNIAWLHRILTPGSEPDQALRKDKNENLHSAIHAQSLRIKTSVYPPSSPNISMLRPDGLLLPCVYFDESTLLEQEIYPFK
ncbi:hypothetical protein WBW39_15170 [Pectobacterium versatile]|uniref:hypothetical protein n=1 Tax=Pectobacterium TaxID=122277 RepID=UPI0019694983|nr:hypothetical protein [Pectobacterium brasiliense]MBN3171734.1 hypothetical protein [Pectobacterium brasiliense]